MAREPRTRRANKTAPKRNGNRSPRRPSPAGRAGANPSSRGAPFELGEEAMATALLDLVDLSLRVATSEQRGRTSLLEQDRRVLTEVVRALERHRDAAPVADVKRRVKVLTPEQQALGFVRLDFDALCRMAAQEGFTRKRDRVLVDELWSACQREVPDLAVQRDDVEKALARVRDPILRERERNEDRSDWLKPDPDSEESSGKTGWGTSPIAGELLRAIIDACGVKPEVSYAPSSTSENARRLKEAGPALAARTTTAAQRLTYICGLMGVPLPDALWLTHRVLSSNAGHRRERVPRFESLSEMQPRDEAGWSLVRQELARKLVESGECDATGALGVATLVIENAFPTSAEWSGSGVPVGAGWSPPPNPWHRSPSR